MIRCSRRLPWESAPNAQSQLLDALRARGAAVLDLATSNPTQVGLPYPAERIAAALADPRAAAYEPTPQGLPEARRAIAARYAERGFSIDADDLILTASTSEAYALLFKLLCDPGDRVLVPRPSYPLFDFLAALESVRLHPYRLGFDGRFFLDVVALQQAIDEAGAGGELRAILLVSPNNPTGTVLRADEREALVTIAMARNLPIVCDEVFGDYLLGDPPAGAGSLVTERRAVVFTLDGISKSLGLPQLKLGWIHVGGPEPERARLLTRLELVADTWLSVGTPAQLALPSLLPLRAEIAGAIAARCRENLAALQQAVQGGAAQVLPVDGGWSACVRLPATRSDEEWALALLGEAGVLVQPGYFYDFPDGLCAVVASLLPEPAEFAEGAARLAHLVARSG